jgi:hypothetical protein
MYIDAWRKFRAGEVLQPLEVLIAEVVGLHPEYHALLEQGGSVLDKDFVPELGESNPFMHMGMHIAIREQLGCDRPVGIVAAHRQLLLCLQDTHAAEHRMMECLGQSLWEAQRANAAPDEQVYLCCVQALSD